MAEQRKINISEAEIQYLQYKTQCFEYEGEFDAMLLPKFCAVYERTLEEGSYERGERTRLREGRAAGQEQFREFREEVVIPERQRYKEMQAAQLKERQERRKSELEEVLTEVRQVEENSEGDRREPQIQEEMGNQNDSEEEVHVSEHSVNMILPLLLSACI